MGKKMIKKDFVNIRIVLDRSGSMGSAIKETIDSINTFISEQKKEKVNGSITISTFDSGSIEVPVRNIEIKNMKEQSVEISSTQSIIDDARNGKMFIVTICD